MNAKNGITLSNIYETNHTELADTLKVEEHIEDVITEENGEAVFECKVDGHPQPICTWYKNGKLITSSQRMKITSKRKWHRLEIRKVSAADHGIYTIVCRNSSKQLSSKANLFVGYGNLNDGVFYTHSNSKSVRVVKHLRNVKVEKGGRIELEATFQHESIDGNYVWLKNSEVIKQNERTIILSSKRSTNLSVLNVELTDSGVYYVVAKTKQGIVSSYSDVQVTAVEEFIHGDDLLPIIEELLPYEVETNENEEIRLICKAIFDLNTSIQWRKNKSALEENNFIVENYGNHYIGLRGVKVSRTDSGEYSVVLRDEKTGRAESSSCFLTVNPAPTETPLLVELKRPLKSAVACCGSKVAFDCSFFLTDHAYIYVVWHVGHYRVERTNSRFSVVSKGGEFLLYIKKLEPDMSGEVVCEIRKSLPNQRSIYVTCSTASLVVVPPTIVREEKKAHSSSQNGKLYNETTPCDGTAVAVADNCLNHFDQMSESSIDGNGNLGASDVILEIAFCRLEDGLFFLHASRGQSEEVEVSHLAAVNQSTAMSNTIKIQWDDSTVSTSFWYVIDWGQGDDSYVETGVSTVRSFEIEVPPLEHMMRVRVRTALRTTNAIEYSVCFGQAPTAVLKPVKSHELRPMEEFEQDYTKTGDVIGKGAFGSVILVRDGTGEYYAAKVLKTRTQKKRGLAMREFNMMKKLRHPKVVQLMEAFVADDAFILVMDYLWGGELFDRIVEEEHIKEVDVVPYVRQICEALQYLHTYKIAHLDLKPENIICLSPNSGQVKVVDFGLAKILEEGQITRAIYGTKDYVAPEVLNFEKLTLACDMWSLGVVTYLLLSGVMPFAGDTWLERSANITLANYNYNETAFREISDLAKDFVDQLLVLNTEKRMSSAAALDHKWIKEGPPKGTKAGHMKRTRENLKSYLATYRARWQRAGNVVIAAHRLRIQAGSARASAEKDAPCVSSSFDTSSVQQNETS